MVETFPAGAEVPIWEGDRLDWMHTGGIRVTRASARPAGPPGGYLRAPGPVARLVIALVLGAPIASSAQTHATLVWDPPAPMPSPCDIATMGSICVPINGWMIWRNGAALFRLPVSTTSIPLDQYLNDGLPFTFGVQSLFDDGFMVWPSTITYADGQGPPPPQPCTTTYTAEYYNNPTLTAPIYLTACENSINYSWADGAGPNGLIDHFSIRWTGTVTTAAGSLQVSARADDGIRVDIDGQRLIDEWRDQSATTYTATRPITAGPHTFRVEYYENGGEAVAIVSSQVIPPPPINPCLALPLTVTGIKWPKPAATGSMSGSWNPGTFTLVYAGFKWGPQRFEATDLRGCTFSLSR